MGGKGGLAERPLAIWDERKEGVALAQERLNAYFGTNALEMAHLGSLSTPSVVDGIVEFSEVCAAVGMNVSIWDGATSLTAENGAPMFRRAPRLDSLLFPGGDGGQLVWPAIENASRVLRQSHPTAGVWVSAQELSAVGMEQFWANVSRACADGWLAGVAYGPHVRVPLTQFVARATAAGAPVRQ